MRFQDFWRLYLRAHRLPGTRALHYFATAVGILSAVEAIATREPLIFVGGIAVSYAIAIAAHWFVEGNQPLIRVNAFWGAIADLRMCWLAATGRLAAEMARNGVDNSLLPLPGSRSAGPARRLGARRLRTDVPRYALVVASVAGLGAGLSDLRDLFEPMERLIYPAVQLGAPIIAFTGALTLACTALMVARRHAVVFDTLMDSARMPADSVLTQGGSAGWPAPAIAPTENSLRRATLALLAFGLATFGLAELLEHGMTPPHVFAAGAMLVALTCIGGALIWRLFASRALAAQYANGHIEHWNPINEAGPSTRGLRVDGRAEWVDFLETTLSFGYRRQILATTLAAGDLSQGGRLIDIGCGTGELAMNAARSGAESAIGIDATPTMIAIARRRARADRSRAQFEVAVAEALPFADGTADIVTSTYFFHHLPSDVKRLALREMWRVLSPGGRLVITDYGRPRGLIGLVASFPMRFNFHEYVRPQLAGELERMIEEEDFGEAEIVRRFLGYIAVLRLVKPDGPTI